MRGFAFPLVACLFSMAFSVEAAELHPLTGFIVKSVGDDRGLCLVVGEADGKLTASLAEASRLYVQGCSWEAKGIQAGREALVAAGVVNRASIVWTAADHLPYTDNLINLVVCSTWSGRKASLEEIVRVLAPGGTALLGNETNPGAISGCAAKLKQGGVKDVKALSRKGWIRFTKPVDPGFDTWSHNLGGADLSYVNNDKGAGPWQELRWIGEPKFGSLHSTYWGRVTAGGKIYYLENRSDHGKRQMYLVCRDAFNGFQRWQVKSGAAGVKLYATIGETLTCDDRRVYMVEDKTLTARDGQTGKKLMEFSPGFLPKMVTSMGSVLLASDLRVSPRVATRVVALSKVSGKPVWSRPAIAHPAASDGVAFVLAADGLEAVNCGTGASRWKVKTTGGAGAASLFCKGGVVYVKYKPPWKPVSLLAAYDVQKGTALWSHTNPGGGYGMLPYPDKLYMLSHNGKKVDQVTATQLDPRTGKKIKEVQTKGMVRSKCYPSKGTGNFLLYSNSWYFDKKAEKAISPQTVRSPCGLGQVAANGLTYFLPHHCTCEVSMRGVLGMATKSRRTWLPDAKGSAPLWTTGAAPASSPVVETASDWPQYRKDPMRSNASTALLPPRLTERWSVKLGAACLTQATSAYGLVCVAEPQSHRVFALDAVTGKQRWSFVADGRVAFPPALHKGLCLFGTGAGSVYSLDARTGKEIWRMRAAPAEKYIAEEGQFASAWPVIGGVMALNGKIYFSCGRAPNADGGVWLFGADAKTGKISWRTKGHTSGDMFLTDGKVLCLVRTPYKLEDGTRTRGWKSPLGMLSTTSYGSVAIADFMSSMEPALTFNRHNELTDGRLRGESLASSKGLSVAGWRYKHGGGGGSKCGPDWRKKSGQCFLYAEGSSKWRVEDIKQQILALVLCGDTAIAAGVPATRYPDGKPELWVVSGKDGQTLQTLVLKSNPVPDGLSAASGRLYLATEDGRLMCFGSK